MTKNVLSRTVLKISSVAALVFLLALAPGCETDEATGGLIPTCIQFIPDQDPTPGVATLAVDDTLSDCDAAVVELVVTGVDKVWGVSFELNYPAGIAQILPTQTGHLVDVSTSFLGSESQLLIVTEEDPLGLVEIGVTRSNAAFDEGKDPDDLVDPVLLRMGFARLTSSGSGNVTFSDATLWIRELDAEPVPDPVVQFSGGTLVIQ
jgi:hypothetical protein